MKTNAELRQLLAALRARECDERVNVNFSPYCSQKVIAESRLANVQAKIRQVEMEFDRRREITVPGPTLTSRIIQQFSESTCTFGFAQARVFEPCLQGRMLDSPDPFAQAVRSPKRLFLKPCGPGTMRQETGEKKIVTTSESGTTTSKDAGTGEDDGVSSKEKGIESKSSDDTCSCRESSSEDSLDGGKKKLRSRIDEDGRVIVSVAGCSRGSSVKLAPRVVEKVDGISGKDRAENETKGKDNGQVSQIESVDVEEIGNDSGQFHTIAIDDDDGNMDGKLDGGGKSSVETETENDADIKKGVDVETDAWKEANVEEEGISAEAPVDAGLLMKKESETDFERRKIKKEDKDEDNQRHCATVEVKAELEKTEHKDYALVVKKDIVLEPEDVESSSVRSSFEKVEEGDREGMKEESIVENSSDLYKTCSTIAPKPCKSILSKKDTNFETPRKGKKGKSVKIVQMVTRVEYDRQFGDFWGWNVNEGSVVEKKMENRCDEKVEDEFSKDVNRRNETDKDDKHSLSKQEKSTTFGDQQCELVSTAPFSTETNDEIERKKSGIKIDRNALAEKMFPKSRRTYGE